MKMKILFILTIIFSITTLLGSVYVLINHGTVSAGYSAVPMVFALAFGTWYRQSKKTTDKDKE